MIVLAFWVGYMMLVVSLGTWVAKHPLVIGASVLFMYMFGSLLVGVGVSFVMGVFLFLTGVSGMMVAFLYVVALCPNPIFVSGKSSLSYMGLYTMVALITVGGPFIISSWGVFNSFSTELCSVSEGSQWMRDPCMFGGLSELMPFLGVLLFLCMVSVVVLCGQQKQCLGGHMLKGTKRSYV